MIVCRDLRKRYADQIVLDGIDLEIRPGERVAVFGLNGAGKTTLLRCLLGLASFDGEITVGGRSPRDPLARVGLAYVPQRPPDFDLSLEEFFLVFAGLRSIDSTDVAEQAEALGLDLESHGRKRLTELSGGMLQKAVVGLALASHADTLLLDEPTANLDARSRAELLAALGARAGDRTVIVSSHRLEDVAALAERAIVLDRGRIVYDGPLGNLASFEIRRLALDVAVPGGGPAGSGASVAGGPAPASDLEAILNALRAPAERR